MAARVTTLLVMTVLFAAAWSTDHPPLPKCESRLTVGNRSRKTTSGESTMRCLATPVSFPPGGYDAVDSLGRKLRITVMVVEESPAKTARGSQLQ